MKERRDARISKKYIKCGWKLHACCIKKKKFNAIHLFITLTQEREYKKK